MNVLEPGVRLDIVGEAGPLRVLVSEGGEILDGRVIVDHVAYVPSALVPYGACARLPRRKRPYCSALPKDRGCPG